MSIEDGTVLPDKCQHFNEEYLMSSTNIRKDTNLRKAILQAAITGKLKVDNEKLKIEETGKQLLDRIIEERNAKSLADWEEAKKKNPKAKKPAPIVASEIAEDEIPFEIPESWCWCRLGDVGDWKAGSTPSRSNPEFYNGNIPWLKIGDLTDDFVDVIPECISEIALESCSMRLNPVGSVLIAMYGATIGKLGILNIEATTNQACCACITHEPISNKYLFYYLMSQKKALTEKAEGGAQPNISREKLVIYPFPLPPLAVQNAIVAKLEEVLPLVDAYENAVLQKEELKNALPDKVKKAILQEAIQGKLTESWRIEMLKQVQHDGRTEETGKQLLDRIIEERNAKALAEWQEKVKLNPKAKKPAPIVASEIDEDAIPFEIPENWCWCRWGELSDSIQYGYNAPAKETGRIKMVRITDIQNGKVTWETVPYCEISEEEIISYRLRKYDILFARTGGTVGKSFLVDEEPEDAVYAGYLIRTQYDFNKLNPKFMKMFMESQLYWEQLKNGTIATAQPNCNGQTLSKMIIPLPPLAEQNAIVEALEELLPLCENIGG